MLIEQQQIMIRTISLNNPLIQRGNIIEGFYQTFSHL